MQYWWRLAIYFSLALCFISPGANEPYFLFSTERGPLDAEASLLDLYEMIFNSI